MKTVINSLFILLLTPATLTADTIYKSIDENGNVTYSTTPPQDDKQSTSVDIAPPPSEERIKAARDRHDRNKETANILDENRKKREEITAEENRLKREKQKQLQQQRQAEKNNADEDYGYPYIPGRRSDGILPPPQRPVQLPVH